MDSAQQPEQAAAAPNVQRPTHMPALTGIRFFAIFHIFLYHLWVLYDLELDAPFEKLLHGFEHYPELFVRYSSNGWMSTSFFFLLSGFILSYLYWSPEGSLSTSRKRFWVQRFSRIYPIHLIIALLTIPFAIGYYEGSALEFTLAAIASLTLVQAWYPPFVPAVSWPTWTLSALVFLYLIAPWLMRVLARLSHKQSITLLILLPAVSLIPTALTTMVVPDPKEFGQNWSIFVGSTPMFWVAHFAAGLLLARVFGIHRSSDAWRPSKIRFISWGDAALLAAIGIALIPDLKEPLKYFIRHGLMMPLYMVIIVELAKGQGLAAKLFSLPGTGFLGETGFSIFIWQNFVMILLWTSLMISPNNWVYQLEVACLGIIILSIFSTYIIEKPMAKRLRRKFLGSDSPRT